MPQLSTGNSELDYLVGGGVKKNKTLILAGEPGSGKTSVALQFILSHQFSKSKSAYVCIDKKPEKIMGRSEMTTKSFGEKVSSGLLKFVEVSINDWTSEDLVNKLLLTIQLQLDALKQNFEMECLIIDSLLPQILLELSREKKLYFIRELLHIVNSLNTTTICILYDVSVCNFLWMDADLISDQILFYRKNELGYTTYCLEISNNQGNHEGKYRFVFGSRDNVELRHKLC